MLLQELNPGSSKDLAKAAGADWMVRAVDLSIPGLNGSPVRRRAVAIAGRGPHPCRSWLLDGIRQPERILFIETETEGTQFFAVSYHAPPGVTFDAFDFAPDALVYRPPAPPGEPGGDRLFGPAKVHDLDDALRRWLAFQPDEMDRLRSGNPSGPLAITHRAGRRKTSVVEVLRLKWSVMVSCNFTSERTGNKRRVSG
jgi:hypothetical protein